MKSDTVLGHVARKLTTQRENLATEALSFILRTSHAASRAFTKFVHPILLDDPGSLRIETQKSGLDQAIPDMKCYDNKGRLRVIVENKFWASLTGKQPVTYIHELPEGVAALVLFVVPKDRLQLIWKEIVTKCNDDNIPVSDVPKKTTMKAAGIGKGHYIAAISWNDLLDALSAETPLAGEIDCRNDIAQLQGLCKTMDEEELLPLRGDELTDLGMARRFINFSDLPIDIVNEAVSRGLCNKKGLRETNYKYGSGTNIRIGKYTSWVGFDALAWRIWGASPIWVVFPPGALIAEVRNKLVRFRTATPQRFFDFESGWAGVPIFLVTGVEKQCIIEDAVGQIRKLRDELGIEEQPATAHEPTLTDDHDIDPENHT